MRNIKWKAALGITVMLSATFAHGQQPLLTADTQINSAATTTNYGSSTALTVNSTNSALLMFNLADLLPNGTTAAQVLKARLIIYNESVIPGGIVDLYQVTSSWSESSVTYATKPTIANTAAASTTIGIAHNFHEFNMNTLVQSWINTPASNFGVELKASGSTNVTLDSKENTVTSHPAVLEIVLSGPAGPTGPTGATGLKGATGATGPAGPKGAAGATGPQGPAGGLDLPYSATTPGNGSGTYLFALVNTDGDGGGGILGQGAAGPVNESFPGGAGVTGLGGASGPDFTSGGPGVYGVGGVGTTGAGPGGLFVGGTSRGDGSPGVEAIGGDGEGTAVGGYGLYAAGGINTQYVALFDGDIQVTGNVSKAGGSFKIDHPLDPENKYLYHSFVESPDMMNIYNGNVVTDGSGTAIVTMPDWFDALNRDFRYQLTVIGQQFAQAIVASEISNRSFTIRTDKPNIKVSWMVTGIRQDAWANAHRIPVEEEKSEKDKGQYLHPELFGHAGERSIGEPRNLRRTNTPK
jgi:hypothetical protein